MYVNGGYVLCSCYVIIQLYKCCDMQAEGCLFIDKMFQFKTYFIPLVYLRGAGTTLKLGGGKGLPGSKITPTEN